MALTPLPNNTPLTQLRAQGLNADFNRARLVVFPRPKVTPEIREFVTGNLEAIVDELHLEGYYTKNPDTLGFLAKNTGDTLRAAGYLFWPLDSALRSELGAPAFNATLDAIPDELNGALS